MKSFPAKSGIVYVATGSKFLDEAINSAKLSKKYTDSLPVCISTDLVSDAENSDVFDIVVSHPSPTYSYRDKISSLVNLPFANNLFIDSDAFLIRSPADILSYASNSHVAASFAPVRHPPGWSDSSVPKVFGELNTGVLFLKRCRKVTKLISNWLHLYDYLQVEFSQQWDQASFRSVVWKCITESKLRFLPLPPECNLRTPKPWIAGRGQPVYIVHGRFAADEHYSFQHYLNSNIDKFRTFAHWIALNPMTSIRPKFDNQDLRSF